MKIWAWLLLLPALLLVLRTTLGSAEMKDGKNETSESEVDGEGEAGGVSGGTCKPGDDQPRLSLTARTQRAQVVFYGFVTRVYKKKGKQTYPAEFFIVNVFKGADLVAKLLKVDGGYGGVYNLRDKRINVTNFGPRDACLSPLEEQRTFIILANSKTGRRLRAHYDHPGGAAVQWSKENEEEVWRALGWDSWSDWSGCSASCDGGTQERRRYCLNADGCQGYNTERRRCNFFSCNGTLDVLHLQDKHYKPSRFGWRESSTRPGSWRAVRNRPLLVHTRDIYPGGFPKEFSLLITIRPDLGNMGMLFIMHRAYGGEVYLGLGLGTGLELLYTGPSREDDVFPINVAPINVNLTDGHWHQLAISVLEDSSIQVYVDCRWISRQMLRRSALEIPMDTLLYVGGMPGRSYQGEMEQFTISRSPEAVAKQCKPEPIPIIDKTLQDSGLPLGFPGPEYSHHLHHTSDQHDYDDSSHYGYDEYGDKPYDDFDIYKYVEYNSFPDDVYDDYDYYEVGSVSTLNHGWNMEENFIEQHSEDSDGQGEDTDKKEDKRNEKEMADTGDLSDIPDNSQESDDEDLIEGSGVESQEKYELTWSVWSGCSTSCDGGVRIRSYRCLPNHLLFEDCVHAGIETQEQRACNLQPCPSTTTHTTPKADTPTKTEITEMIQSIPYTTSTNVFPSVPVTATPMDQLMTVTTTTTTTTTSPPPTTPATPTTTTKVRVVEMHPLFPTTVISPPRQPVNEPFFNDTSKVYPDAKPQKPPKVDEARVDTSYWLPKQTVTDRTMNEVLPRGVPPVSSSKRTSWNHKWSYQYHHHHHHHHQQQQQQQQQHRMRHHHSKHHFDQRGQDCGGGCLNQGLCGYGGVCHCARGWHGRHCEVAECGHGCLNGGVCVAPDTCRCPPGYKGSRCQEVLCSRGCGVGGVCMGVERCRCGRGYTGPSCTLPKCDPPCSNGGTCTSPGVCTCPEGYSGLWCTVRKCKYVPKQVAYTRSYKKVVPQRVETHCGAWGWKSCTSVRQVYQTVTQKFYRTVYTCEPAP